MRIPTAIVRTSPPSSITQKSTTPSVDHNVDKGSLNSTQARAKQQLLLPKSQRQSLSQTTVTSNTQRSQESQETLSDLLIDSPIATIIEARKKKLPANEQPYASHKTSSSILSQRAHVNHKLLLNSLSPISENSNEDSVAHIKEIEMKKSQAKLVELSTGKTRMYEATARELSAGETNKLLRNDAPYVENLGCDSSEGPTKDAHVWETLVKDCKLNRHMGDSQTCGRSLRNEGQGDPCGGTTEISMSVKPAEKNEIVSGNQYKKGNNADERNYASSIGSESQDMETQISSKDANHTSVSRSTTHMVAASTKHTSNPTPDNYRNAQIAESQACLLQSLKDKVVMDSTKANRKARLMQTKSGSHNGLNTARDVDSDNARSRFHMDMKATLFGKNDTDNSDEFMDANMDSKCFEEKKSSRLHSSALLENEGMAPPPLGYHVRKDFSNPDSSIELLKKLNHINDVNVFRKHKINDPNRPVQPVSSDESFSYHGKGDMWRILYPKHKEKDGHIHRLEYVNENSGLVTESHTHRHQHVNGSSGTAKAKRSRKLLIIGKLNCFLDAHKRKGKHGAKAQLVLARGNKNAFYDGNRSLNGDCSLDSVRIDRAYSKVHKGSGEHDLGSSEMIKQNEEIKSTKLQDALAQLGPYENGSKGYSKMVNQKGKYPPGLYFKRNARHQSVFKLSNGVCLKRLDVSQDSQEDKALTKRPHKTTDSHSCVRLAADFGKHSIGPRLDFQRRGNTYRKMDLMPVRHMNVNSNAGIFEPSHDDSAVGKPEVRQSSGSSLHNSKQCYSTHTVTENSVFVGSGNEVPHDRPLTQKVISGFTPHTRNTQQSLLIISKSSDQLKKCTPGKHFNNEMVTERHTEAASVKNNKKNLLQTYSEKSVNLTNEKQMSKSHTALKVAPSDGVTHSYSVMAATNLQRKNNRKVVESSTSTLDSMASNKTNSTVSVKSSRRIIMNRPRQEPQKQLSLAGDVHKAVINAMEKSSRHFAENARFARLMKNNEYQNDNMDVKLKHRSSYETNLVSDASKETNHLSRVSQKSQEVRSTESDHRNSPLKALDATSRSQDVIKKLASLSKTVPYQSCHKKTLLPLSNHVYTSGVHDIKYSSEGKYLSTIKPRLKANSPISQKSDGEASNLPVKKETNIKTDVQEMCEILMKEFNNSPIKELISSPQIEIEKCQNTQLSSSPNEKSSRPHANIGKDEQTKDVQNDKNKDMDVGEADEVCLPPEATLEKKADSMISEVPVISKSVSVRNCFSCLSEHSSPTNTFDYINKRVSRRFVSDTMVEDGPIKVEVSETIQDKYIREFNSVKKKKSQQRYKPQSKSPDCKKKKRVARKFSSDGESSKSEKTKKLKSLDKLPEKKKKKKKVKQKSLDRSQESSESDHTAKNKVCKLKMEPPEGEQTHQVASNSELNIRNEPGDNDRSQTEINPALQPAAGTTPNTGLPSKAISEDNGVILPTRLANKHNSHERTAHSLDRLQVRLAKENNFVTSSAENISIPSEPTLQEPSNSTPALAAPPVKTQARVPLIPANLKAKRNEKNLQEAELGWNSSTFSSDDKALLEKGRLNAKRAKLRYYIVKPKPKKGEVEVVTSKLKRPSTRLSLTDDHVTGLGSELDINGDAVPQEKSKPGQVKSVQFSDNIQDLEASKSELGNEWLSQRPSSDNVVHHSITKTSTENFKVSTKVTLETETVSVGKCSGLRKDELRPQITSPRRKRPVWSKKSVQNKQAGAMRAYDDKHVSAAVKQHNSSDSIAKPSSRFNIHLYYPLKSGMGSPKLVNLSPGDKRRVSYNTWISSMCAAAPLNKSFKKLVAKTGSPVDIREIIEGSSVDGIDHMKSRRSPHDGTVRAAKSVPSVGSQRGLGIDSFAGKKSRMSEDVSFTAHKKGRDFKLRDSWSPQTRSVIDGKENPDNVVKCGSAGTEQTNSQDWSTNVDSVALSKRKKGHHRFTVHGNFHRKENGLNKKKVLVSATKWQLVAAQEARIATDLSQVRYCDEMMELNVFNMGLTWVVQNVVTRLPFLNQKQSEPNFAAIKDTPSDQKTETAPNV